MNNIKTRNVVKGTIKTLDKAAIAGERMKSTYTKTKQRAESAYTADEASPSEYASGRISRNSEFLAREGRYRLNQIGRKNFKEVKGNLIKARDSISSGVKTKNTASIAEKGKMLKEGMFVKGYNHQRLKGNAVLKQNLAKLGVSIQQKVS